MLEAERIYTFHDGGIDSDFVASYNYDDTSSSTCTGGYAYVEVVPLSPDSIEEVKVDVGDYNNPNRTESEYCYEKMYLNCFCDPPASSTESDWQYCLEKDTRLGAMLCLFGIDF